MPLSNYSFFSKKRVLPILFCHKSEPSKQYMSFRIIWKKIATIATLATNQELTLFWKWFVAKLSDLGFNSTRIWSAVVLPQRPKRDTSWSRSPAIATAATGNVETLDGLALRKSLATSTLRLAKRPCFEGIGTYSGWWFGT